MLEWNDYQNSTSFLGFPQNASSKVAPTPSPSQGPGEVLSGKMDWLRAKSLSFEGEGGREGGVNETAGLQQFDPP